MEHLETLERQYVSVREHLRDQTRKLPAVLLFIAFYVLFAAARLASRVDPEWYDSANSPAWLLPLRAQEVIWFVMFGFLALSSVYVFRNAAGTKTGHFVFAVRIVHYIALQAFVFLLFHRQDLLLASIDSVVIFLAAAVAAVAGLRKTEKGAALLGTYAVWTLYNAAATVSLYLMNGR